MPDLRNQETKLLYMNPKTCKQEKFKRYNSNHDYETAKVFYSRMFQTVNKLVTITY